MKTKIRLIGACVAVAVLAAGAFATVRVAMAGESGDEPSVERQSKRDAFLERVAGRLDIDVATLTSAIEGAHIDAINEAEANGTINPERAAKARERIENGEGIGLGQFHKPKHERRQAHTLKIARGAIFESSATAIGVTADELKAELKAGKSIADVAGEHSVSIDTVKAQILSDADAKLDGAVSNGRITQERADAALAKLTEKLDEVLAKKHTVELATP